MVRLNEMQVIGVGMVTVVALATAVTLARMASAPTAPAPSSDAPAKAVLAESPPAAAPSAPAAAAEALAPGVWHAPSEHDRGRCRTTCPESSYVNDVDSDLHVVGVYEPARDLPREGDGDDELAEHEPGPSAATDKRPGARVVGRDGEVVVTVEASPRPIDLVLTSYEPVQWRIVLGTGARVRSVRYASYEPGSRVVGAPAVALALDEQEHQWEPEEDGSFADYIAAIRRASHTTEATFQGAYSGVAFHVPFARDPDAARLRERAELERVARLAVPSADELAAADRDRTCTHAREPCAFPFAITETGLRDVQSGHEHQFSPAVAALSWKRGIALDTRRQRIVLVSFGGEGAIVTFDLRTKRWSEPRSMRDVDVGALTYDAGRDMFWAAPAFHGRSVLFRLSSELVALPPLELSAALPEIETLAVVGGRLVASGTRSTERWQVDPTTGAVAPL